VAPINKRLCERIQALIQAQAAPDQAAAEEIPVPMDDSILAGPTNPAIAFHDEIVPSQQ
jgi:hypothetical protein